MADTLPKIDFGFDALRDRMAKFTLRFDQFIDEGRKRVLEERNQFRSRVAELQEDQKMKQRDIEIISHKSTTYAQTLAKEATEAAEMRAAIADIAAQRDERSTHRERLRLEVAAVQKSIDQRLELQRQYTARMDAQTRCNLPELQFWTDYLCMRIEGAGVVDRLKFIFTHVDEKNWETEAWFELCTEKRDYDVKGCNPDIGSGALESCLAALNETRDLGQFLKSMRELFVKALQ